MFQGYNWLHDQREMSIGMGGVIPQPIPISEMETYYKAFNPLGVKTHFMRVIRAADKAYISVYHEEQNNKSKAKDRDKKPGHQASNGSTFPPVPQKE